MSRLLLLSSLTLPYHMYRYINLLSNCTDCKYSLFFAGGGGGWDNVFSLTRIHTWCMDFTFYTNTDVKLL